VESATRTDPGHPGWPDPPWAYRPASLLGRNCFWRRRRLLRRRFEPRLRTIELQRPEDDEEDYHAAGDNPDQIKHDPTPYQPPPVAWRLYTATPASLPSYSDAHRSLPNNPSGTARNRNPLQRPAFRPGFGMKVSHRYLAVVPGLLLEGAWIPPRSEPFSGRQAGGGDGQSAALPPPCAQCTLTTWRETRQAEIPARIDVPLAALPSSLQTQRDRGPVSACRSGAGASPAESGGSMGCRCDRRAAQPDRACSTRLSLSTVFDVKSGQTEHGIWRFAIRSHHRTCA
jgi:hypothetical protein